MARPVRVNRTVTLFVLSNEPGLDATEIMALCDPANMGLLGEPREK